MDGQTTSSVTALTTRRAPLVVPPGRTYWPEVPFRGFECRRDWLGAGRKAGRRVVAKRPHATPLAALTLRLKCHLGRRAGGLLRPSGPAPGAERQAHTHTFPQRRNGMGGTIRGYSDRHWLDWHAGGCTYTESARSHTCTVRYSLRGVVELDEDEPIVTPGRFGQSVS